MIRPERFDGNLARMLEDLADVPRPAYADDILAATRTMRQRPAWTFSSRWLPTAALAPAGAVRPYRPVIIALLAALLVVLGLVVGAQRREREPSLPAPFGPAGNGLVVYASGGDLFTVHPVTDERRPLISGPEVDSGGGYSPNGTLILFTREIAGQPWLMVATAAGADVHPIMDRPALGVLSGSWSADSRSLALVSELNGRPRISIHPVDGPAITTLDLGIDATWPVYRPPDGRQLLFRGVRDGVVDLYLVDPDGTDLQPLGRHGLGLFGDDLDLLAPAWSPDGRFITYHTVDPGPNGADAQTTVHLLDPETGVDRVLSPLPAGIHQGWTVWSPDGSLIAVQRWEFDGTGRFAIIPADGRDSGIEVDLGTPTERGPWIAGWSPDGTRLLEFLDAEMGVLSVDPKTGDYTRLDWPAEEPVDWQRVGR